jgi:hypothetical protein
MYNKYKFYLINLIQREVDFAIVEDRRRGRHSGYRGSSMSPLLDQRNPRCSRRHGASNWREEQDARRLQVGPAPKGLLVWHCRSRFWGTQIRRESFGKRDGKEPHPCAQPGLCRAPLRKISELAHRKGKIGQHHRHIELETMLFEPQR